jgi:hypothetical protein
MSERSGSSITSGVFHDLRVQRTQKIPKPCNTELATHSAFDQQQGCRIALPRRSPKQTIVTIAGSWSGTRAGTS